MWAAKGSFSPLFLLQVRCAQICFLLEKLWGVGIVAWAGATHCSSHLQCDPSSGLQESSWLVSAFTSTASTQRFLHTPILFPFMPGLNSTISTTKSKTFSVAIHPLTLFPFGRDIGGPSRDQVGDSGMVPTKVGAWEGIHIDQPQENSYHRTASQTTAVQSPLPLERELRGSKGA